MAANGIASFEQLSFAQTDTSNMAVSVYERSKTLAEQAAWNFIRTEGEGLEFVTINPVAILGPSLGSAPSDSSSFTMHISKRGK